MVFPCQTSSEWQSVTPVVGGAMPRFLYKTAIVYIATNILTSDTYIGFTTRPLRRRISDHVRAAYNGRSYGAFPAAIRQYGADAFRWSIIREFSSAHDAIKLEQELIAQQRPAYNATKGGHAFKPRVVSDQERNALRIAGRENIAKWRQYAHLGPAAMARPIICLDDGATFESANAAARAYGLNVSSIIEVCLRKPYRHRAGGRIFRYMDDCEGLDAALKRIADARKKAKQATTNVPRPIQCVEDGRIFPNAREAAEAYGARAGDVSSVCRGARKQTRDRHFIYCGEPTLPPLGVAKGAFPSFAPLLGEKWKRLSGDEEIWAISDHGRVCSLDRAAPHRISGTVRKKGKILGLRPDKDGYPTVALRRRGKNKTWHVHTLVAEMFIGPNPRSLSVLHRNGVRDDNRAANLYYGTAKDRSDASRVRGTMQRGEKQWFSKLTESNIRDLLRLKGTIPQREIAVRFGVTQSTVQRILAGESWRHVTQGDV